MQDEFDTSSAIGIRKLTPQLGAEVSGSIGDANPLQAIRAALHGQPFDEIILSTLPLGLSRWVKQDLPHRVRREYDLPISHVVEERRAKGA